MRAHFVACVIAGALLAGCGGTKEFAVDVPGGDAERGHAALVAYQCGACHVIAGVAGARGQVGPPLKEFRHRVYIAGRLPNEPTTLIRFIQNPPAMIEDTAMPEVGVSEAQATDMAAYLYRLE